MNAGILLWDRSVDGLGLAFSVKCGEGEPRTNDQSHGRVWKRWRR